MKPLVWASMAAVFVASAAWATDPGVPTYAPQYAPNGTHVQSGTPGCTVTDLNVSCNGYDVAGVGHTNATATLAVTYSGTVICTNSGGNVAPGQTQYPSMPVSTGKLNPKNGRLTVPLLETTNTTGAIDLVLIANTHCPKNSNKDGKWTKSVQPGSEAVVGYLYTLVFDGFNSNAYITISG